MGKGDYGKKGYGNSLTAPVDVVTEEYAKHLMLSLCETVGTRLRSDNVKISVVSVHITTCEFQYAHKQIQLLTSTDVTEEIYTVACRIFKKLWDGKTPIRQIGVHTSKVESDAGRQYNLFDMQKYNRLRKGMAMCGVFYVDDDTMREIEKIARKIDRKQAAAGDVHPSQPALILHANHEEIVSEVLKWGYEAYGKKTLIFNARSETVQERPMFKYDFEERRCLIPAGKFYEWKQDGTKKKEKYEFFTPDKILYLAGIYHKDPEGDRFTILTREAEGCMTGIHPRMPLILYQKDMERWLFSREEAEKLLESHYKELERRGNEEYHQMSLIL